MKNLSKYIFTLIFIILSLKSFSNSESINTFTSKVTEHISAMQSHTQNLVGLSCDSPKEEFVKHWKLAYSNYLAISYMDLEVINKFSLNYSFSFWPDKKNLINKKIKTLISNNEFTSELINKSSAPVKGYQAIEYLLFDPSLKTIHCEALKAIAKNQLNNIQLILNDLSDSPIISQEIIKQDLKEAQSISFNEIANHLSALIKKIETVRNDNINEKLYFSDAWRSKLALFFHKANLANSIDYILIMSKSLTPDSQTKINNQIEIINDQTKSLPDSYFEIYENDQKQVLLDHLAEIKKLNSLLSDLILKDLDLSLGFNNSDGD